MMQVLVLSPHPDDESIGCGGTLCKHVREGDVVSVIFLTSGERGGHGRPAAETRRVREAEAKRAALTLGIQHIEFWGEPDGALRATGALVCRLQERLREAQPDLIYLPHQREAHPDHRAVGRILRATVRGSIIDMRRTTVRMFEVWTPIEQIDEVVDITPFIEMKIRAIRRYRSQCDIMRFDEAARGLARWRGEMHSWPEGDYAEVFTLPSKCS